MNDRFSAEPATRPPDRRRTIDLNALLDGQGIRPRTVLMLAIAILAMIVDGYDVAAMGFVAPELVKEWHVAPSALTPALSASVLGLFLGAPLFGLVGDRIGRKAAIATTLAVVSVATLPLARAGSLTEFMVLRFVTGLGVGGLGPNLVALATEMAPRRMRGVFAVTVSFGFPAGISAAGWIAALLVPAHGWPVLLVVGGLAPLAMLVPILGLLPESLRFLAQKGGQEARLRRLARAARPDLLIDADTTLAIAAPASGWTPGYSGLFGGGLRVLTPLLWVMIAANQFANFFTVSWLPTVLQGAGASTSQAGVTASLFSAGGLLGGLALLFVIDRLGAVPVAALFVLAVPAVASIGFAHDSPVLLGLVIACAGFCVTGNNFGFNAVLGIVYPTAVRSKGGGLAQAIGRIGALAAQVAAGALLQAKALIADMFLVPAAVLVLGAAAACVFGVLCFRIFGGLPLDDSAADQSHVPHKAGVR